MAAVRLFEQQSKDKAQMTQQPETPTVDDSHDELVHLANLATFHTEAVHRAMIESLGILRKKYGGALTCQQAEESGYSKVGEAINIYVELSTILHELESIYCPEPDPA